MSLDKGSLGPVQPQRESAVPSALSCLDNAISALQESFGNLRGRLGPICRTDTPITQDEPETASICEVSDLINNQVRRINNLKEEIDYVRSTLEV